jgi:hypothetical protein
MPHRARAAQDGFILITVVVIGFVAALVMAGVLTAAVPREARAVDQKLADIRAYWLAQGHFRYAFSRIRQDYLCSDADGVCTGDQSQQDSDMAMVLNDYLNDITALRHMTYREESAGYWIDVGATALINPSATHAKSQYLMMRSSFPGTQSTLPTLAGIAQRAIPLEIRFCVHMTNWTDPCGSFSTNNFGGTLNGYYRITQIAPY